MNPSERQREFREKLRQTNPRLARKYEAYSREKKEAATGEDAYRRIVFEETSNDVASLLDEKGYIEDDKAMVNLNSETIVAMWVDRFKTRRKGYDIFGKLGINSLEVLVERYIAYAKGQKGKISGEGFYQYLVDELESQDTDFDEELAGPLFLQSYLFPLISHSLEEGLDGETGHPYSDEYYQKQYRRLEREDNLHTQEAENIFMRLLKEIYIDDKWMTVPDVADISVPLTCTEVKEAVENGGSIDLQLAVSSNFGNRPDGTFFVVVHETVIPIDDSRKGGNNSLKERDIGSFMLTSGSDISKELMGLLNQKKDEIDERETEKRIRKVVEMSEDLAMDQSPELARATREIFIDYRFAKYLFDLARRRRSELPVDPFAKPDENK